MTSAFWGGFAGTLLKERQADDASERETEAFKKKQQILKEMERREEPDVDQKVFHIFDGNGKEIGTRPMTPYQIKQYERDQKKGDLEIGGLEARTQKDKKEAEIFEKYGEQEAGLGIDAKRANIAQSQASVASSYHSMRNSDARLSLDQSREGRQQRLDELKLKDAERTHGPATVAAVQALALPQVQDIITHGGNLALNDFRKSVEAVIKTNPNLRASEAAQIVISAMQKRYGAKVESIRAAQKAGGL